MNSSKAEYSSQKINRKSKIISNGGNLITIMDNSKAENNTHKINEKSKETDPPNSTFGKYCPEMLRFARASAAKPAFLDPRALLLAPQGLPQGRGRGNSDCDVIY